MVHVQVDEAVRDAARERQLLVEREAGDVGRGHVLDRAHVAGEQRRDPRRILRDDAQRRALPGRLRPPVGVVAREFDPVVELPAHEAPRAGAVDRAAGIEVFGGCLLVLRGNHVDGRQVVRQQRIRRLRAHPDGERIDHLHVGDLPGVDAERGRALRYVRRAAQRGDHVGGGEVGAVVEAHALAQPELPGELVDRAPGFGEARPQPVAAVLRDERLVKMLHHVVVRRQVVEMRVHRGDRRGQADRQFLCARRRLRQRDEGTGCDQQQECSGGHAAHRWHRQGPLLSTSA